MRIALIDYGAGNLHSAAKALERAAREADIPCTVGLAEDAAAVAAADRIVLPGDGAFRDCMGELDRRQDLRATLERRVRREGAPFLGICVGMQLLATTGVEHGDTPGLGWIPGRVERISPADPALKVPHMGWNTLAGLRPHPLLEGLALGPEGLHAYFLHSYHLLAADGGDVLAAADYGGPVTAVVARENVAGAQFHPEKSQRLGLRLLGNFLRWRP